MEQLMKAIVLVDDKLTVQQVAKPQQAAPAHVVIKMDASAINSGDKFFLKHPSPVGSVKSQHDIKGVSGAGRVLQTGEGVPAAFQGKNVAFYRNLKYSDSTVGAWNEYVHVHFLDCIILPEDASTLDYAGSVVNVITPFAFLQEVKSEDHQAIISTAGNSATGIALLGFCEAAGFPLLSIVRNEAGKQELETLGAKNVLVQNDPDFSKQLQTLAASLNATAIFDGVGGDILNKIILSLPNNSVIYSYGYIGDAVPLSITMSILAVKNIRIQPFSNLKSATVQDPALLEAALKSIGAQIHLPHFKTKIGKQFRLEDIDEALTFKVENGRKAILMYDHETA